MGSRSMMHSTHDPIVDRGVVAGNVTDKYGTRNPIARWLTGRFLATVGALYDQVMTRVGDGEVLEVGCGEGELCQVLRRRRAARFFGTDLSPRILEIARGRHPWLPLAAQSATVLGFADARFDLVLACEVLEHLPDPEAGLAEIARVCRRHVILSVPCEPLWRALNLARGAYLRELGNTPGHLQHWSRSSFVRLVSRHLHVEAVRSPLPWTVVAATVVR